MPPEQLIADRAVLMGVVPEGAGLVVGNLDLYGINSPRLHLAQDVIPIPQATPSCHACADWSSRGRVGTLPCAAVTGVGGQVVDKKHLQGITRLQAQRGLGIVPRRWGLDQACFTSRRILHEVARNGGMESGLCPMRRPAHLGLRKPAQVVVIATLSTTYLDESNHQIQTSNNYCS